MSRKPRPTGAIHVVTNRRQGKGREYVTHLLRRSYREGGKVRNETVGNISHLPEELVELVRAGLRGEPVGVLSDAFEIERSLPAGHVSAALAMARRLELARLLDRSAVAGAGSGGGDDLSAGDRAGVEARDRARVRAVDAGG